MLCEKKPKQYVIARGEERRRGNLHKSAWCKSHLATICVGFHPKLDFYLAKQRVGKPLPMVTGTGMTPSFLKTNIHRTGCHPASA